MATKFSGVSRKPALTAVVRSSVTLVLTFTIILLTACNGPDENQKHDAGASKPSAAPSAAPPSSVPAAAPVTDSQRVIIFAGLEEPCALGETTGGSIRPLRLTFVGTDLPATSVGSAPQTPPRIEPNVAGAWRWTAKNELSFTPDADWVIRRYELTVPAEVLPVNFALFSDKLTFNPRESCINTRLFRKPYSITTPKLPSRPTDVVPDALLIAFDRPVVEGDRLQQKFTQGASLEPAIKGEWVWQSEKTLTFQPSENWQPGTNYIVRFKPEVFAKNAVIPGYEYRFSTPQSDLERARTNLYVSAPSLPEWDEIIKPAPLSVNFREPVAPTHLIDKPLADASLTPAIQGEFRWADDKQLVFKPAEHWRPGTRYRLVYNSRIFGDSAGEKTYVQQFDTPPFEASIRDKQFYMDPTDPSVKRVTATFHFSHPVDRSEFERHISLDLMPLTKKQFPDGKASRPFGFKVSWDKFGKEAYITSDQVTLPEDDAEMLIRLSSGVHSSLPLEVTTFPESAKVYVPGVVNYFKVESVSYNSVENKSRNLDQVIIVQMTTGVKPDAASKISAKLLPEFEAETPAPDEVPTKWEDLSQLTPAVLERSEPLELTAIPSEQEFTKQLSFKFRAKTGRSILVIVPAGIESQDGYRLTQELRQIVYVGELPKTIKLMSNGSLLSLTGEKKLSLMTRGVKTVEIGAARILPGTIAHLISQTSGAINNPYFMGYRFSEDDIAERFTERREVHSEGGETNYSAIDVGALLNKKGALPRGLFLFTISDVSKEEAAKSTASSETSAEFAEGESEEGYEEEGADSGYNYYGTARNERRLVLVTDLGPLVKMNQDGSRELFVQSLSARTPVENAAVKVIGRNGLPLIVRTTGADGHVSFPKLSDFTREKEPTVYVIEKDGDLSFMPYERSDRRLNLSRFDVGGLQTQNDLPGIQAFLFSDRGIYRPGDELHFGLVLKPDNWTQDISNIPLEAVLTDPRGLEIRKEKVRFGKDGFEEFSHTTQESSPTGRYQLTLYVVKDEKRGSALGSAGARVEEFLPDRMTINAEFNQKDRKGWLNPSDLKADITLMNLFGTPAAGRRVQAAMTLAPTIPSFKYRA